PFFPPREPLRKPRRLWAGALFLHSVAMASPGRLALYWTNLREEAGCMPRALVIINSRSRSGQESRERVIDLLRGGGLDLEVPVLRSPEEITPLVYAHRD